MKSNSRGVPQRRSFDIGGLVATVGHGILQQVGQAQLQRIEFSLHRVDAGLGSLPARRQLLAAREQRRRVLALALGHADLLGGGIALGAQPVGLDLRDLRRSSSAASAATSSVKPRRARLRGHVLGEHCAAVSGRSLVFPVVSSLVSAPARAIASPMRISKPRGTG